MSETGENRIGLASFVWLRSPAVKRWARADDTLGVLTELAAMWSAGAPLVLDLSAGRKPDEVLGRCGGLDVLVTRRTPPSRGPLARLFSLDRGDCSLLLRLTSPTLLATVLNGDAIWDADFTLFPEVGIDPHSYPDANADLQTWVDTILPKAGWGICQITGKYDWLVAAWGMERRDAMAEQARQVFAARSLPLDLSENTGTVHLAIGKSIIDLR
jgi:hypothetical protein